jgi:hypothetical protein
MGCNRLASCIDAFLDGEIAEAERRVLDEHIGACADCVRVLAREQSLQRVLKARPVPEPSAESLERTLKTAMQRGAQRKRSLWGAAVGGALAAGLAVWAAIGALQQREVLPAQAPPVASVSMTLHETRTIQLVFASPADLADAHLSLLLPPGVELAGHDGQTEIRWRTSLQRGKNVLPLELVVREGSGGLLVARLEHGDRQKTFRVRVTVRPNQAELPTKQRSTTA